MNNSVFDCHLSPVGQQMAIKNSVSIDFFSTFLDSIDIFDCPLPGMSLGINKSDQSLLCIQKVGKISLMLQADSEDYSQPRMPRLIRVLTGCTWDIVDFVRHMLISSKHQMKSQFLNSLQNSLWKSIQNSSWNSLQISITSSSRTWAYAYKCPCCPDK